jgi:Glyoxalase superfamily protein
LSGSAGTLIRLTGLDALHEELSGKSGRFSPSEITFTQWDSRIFNIIDPSGNALQFWENNPPGVARVSLHPRLVRTPAPMKVATWNRHAESHCFPLKSFIT